MLYIIIKVIKYLRGLSILTNLTEMKSLFKQIENCKNISIYFIEKTVKTENGKKIISDYNAYSFQLSLKNFIKSYVSDISHNYSISANAFRNFYDEIVDYNNFEVTSTIYRLSTSSELIKEESDNLINKLADPEMEFDLASSKQKDKYHFAARFKIEAEAEIKSLILVSMANPVKVYKHPAISLFQNKYKELEKAIILPRNIDLVFFDGYIYFLSPKGETLFNIERTIKKICQKELAKIEASDIISDMDAFRKEAFKGTNPKKFLSFNENTLNGVKLSEKKEEISKKLGIPLTQDLKFDTSQKGFCAKLILLLCEKAMYNPIDLTPMEVPGAKTWRKE